MNCLQNPLRQEQNCGKIKLSDQSRKETDMKLKLFSVIMALLMGMTMLTACKNKSDESVNSNLTDEQSAPETEQELKPEDTTDYQALLKFQFDGLNDTPASDFTYTVSNGSVSIMGYTGTAEKIRVPSTIDGLPVTAIGESAFADQTDLKVLWIPDSVTTFGKELLKGCNQIFALRTPLPQTEGNAFLGYLYGATDHLRNNVSELRALDYLELGGAMTELPSYALYDCNDLLVIKIPETVTTLKEYSLYRCESLKSLNTQHLRVIESHAMDFCTSLETLEFSDSLESVGLGAFENCLSLRRLTVPFIGETRQDNTYLAYMFGAADYGFSAGFYPPSLHFVTITEGTETIWNHAFYECDSLREVTLPSTVTSIGTRAFSGCERLQTMTLPNGSLTVGDSAFSGCTRLQSISLGNSLRSIGTNAFLNCTALTEITFPNSLTAIPNSCFHGCESLTAVNFGGVTTVGKNAFYGCFALETVSAVSKIKFEDGNQMVEELLKE